MVNAKALGGYCTQLTHLPMRAGSGVLSETIARGVERGLFAYALGDGEAKEFDTIRFKESVSAESCELDETAWLLRPALAVELLPKPEPVETGGAPTGGTTTEPSGGYLPGGEEPPPPSTGPHICECERRCCWGTTQAAHPERRW